MPGIASTNASNSRGGGAAVAAGVQYQARVTAWWAAHVLLQSVGIGKQFDLPDSAMATRIYCETTDSVDDVRIEFNDGVIFGQCKRSLQRSTSPDSEFGGVFHQFLSELGRDSFERTQSRFVLFYEEHNSRLRRLGILLNRHRTYPAGTNLGDAAMNNDERQIAADLDQLLVSVFSTPKFAGMIQLRESLLRLSYIKQLSLALGDSDRNLIETGLANTLLERRDQSSLAIESLQGLANDLMANRASVDRADLRRRLQDRGFVLLDSPDFRDDFRKLDAWTTDQISSDTSAGRNTLRVGSRTVQIVRPVQQELHRAVTGESFLVIGEAGVGKTGALLNLVRDLQSTGNRVWYWAADSVRGGSIHEIRGLFNIEHTWDEIFGEAASGRGVTIIVDGLDSLRDARAARAFRNLINLARSKGLKVIASIRIFDLSYSHELQKLFPVEGDPISESFINRRFVHVRHVLVTELRDEELNQLQGQIDAVGQIMGSSQSLREVLSILFYLELLCELLDQGTPVSDFSIVGTRAELFELWWQRRIDSSPNQRNILQDLSSIVEVMVRERQLSVSYDEWRDDVRHYLLSTEILRESPAPTGRLRDDSKIEFRHHFLFDHVAMKLFIRPRRIFLATDLIAPVNWGLFLRPSLLLFFRYAWTEGRHDFWDLIVSLENSGVFFLHRMPGYIVLVTEARTLLDLSPTLQERLAPFRIQLIQGIVATARYSCLEQLFSRNSGEWWLEYANRLIETREPNLMGPAEIVLSMASQHVGMLSETGRLLLNSGASALVRYYIAQGTGPDGRIIAPIGWVCRTISCNPEQSAALIRGLLSADHLRDAGYLYAPAVAYEIGPIWRQNPVLAAEIYELIFSFEETDRTITPLSRSAILTLTSTRRQDYERAVYLLFKDYKAFLQGHPGHATAALVRIFTNLSRPGPEIDSASVPDIFLWDGAECRIEYGELLEEPRPDDHEARILKDWEDFLVHLPDDNNDAENRWELIASVLISENECAWIWRTLLKAADHRADFYYHRLWSFLIVPRVLFGPGTRIMARNCVRSFAPYLADHLLNQIQTVTLSTTSYTPPGQASPLSEEVLMERKISIISAVPDQQRISEARHFLALCDPELVRRFERDESFSDEIISRHRVDWDEPSGNESRPLVEIEIEETVRFLEGLSPENITNTSIVEILSQIKGLNGWLSHSGTRSASPHFIRRAQAAYLAGLALIACAETNQTVYSANRLFEIFREVLLLPTEESSGDAFRRFDEFPSWGAPDPLVSAAQGLACLVERSASADPGWEEVLRLVARHPYPKVRWQVVRSFLSLMTSYPEFVWETLEMWIHDISRHDGGFVLILAAFQGGLLSVLRGTNTDRSNQLLRNLCETARLRAGEKVRNRCGELMGSVWVIWGEQWILDVTMDMAAETSENMNELDGLVTVSSRAVFRTGETQVRANQILTIILESAHEAVEQYFQTISQHSGPDSQHDPPEWLRQAAGLFEHVAAEFTRQATELKESLEKNPANSDSRVRIWWDLSEPMLERLLGEPHPWGLYLIMKGLKDLAPFSPGKSLHWLRRITETGTSRGLNFEHAAMDETIEILERFLANHWTTHGSEEVLDDLVHIVEHYLRAGWPRALRMAIDLEGIFR
ncbi:MAG: hypothetical protein ACLQPD_21885 [Desulfomonilaceae bacterium]